MFIPDKNRNEAGEVLRRLPEDIFSSTKFIERDTGGRGNSKTKLVTLDDGLSLIMVLPGKMAKEMRDKFSHIIRRYMAGDKSLAREIEANGASDHPFANMARASMNPFVHVLDLNEIVPGGYLRITSDNKVDFFDLVSALGNPCREDACRVVRDLPQEFNGHNYVQDYDLGGPHQTKLVSLFHALSFIHKIPGNIDALTRKKVEDSISIFLAAPKHYGISNVCPPFISNVPQAPKGASGAKQGANEKESEAPETKEESCGERLCQTDDDERNLQIRKRQLEMDILDIDNTQKRLKIQQDKAAFELEHKKRTYAAFSDALKSAADITDKDAREIMMDAVKSDLKQYATKGDGGARSGPANGRAARG